MTLRWHVLMNGKLKSEYKRSLKLLCNYLIHVFEDSNHPNTYSLRIFSCYDFWERMRIVIAKNLPTKNKVFLFFESENFLFSICFLDNRFLLYYRKTMAGCDVSLSRRFQK